MEEFIASEETQRGALASGSVGVLSCAPKVCRFDPWSGRVGKATDGCYSLLRPLSLKSRSLSSGED